MVGLHRLPMVMPPGVEAWSEKMKKKKKQTGTDESLKKEIGGRFKLFRLDKDKVQHALASEFEVHQSTVTNIEKGVTFPKLCYLKYIFEKYGLNLNWLISGIGSQYMEGVEYKGSSRVMSPDMEYDGYTYDQYHELTTLMRIPVIEQVIFAKLSECKILFKDDVKEFFEKQEKEMWETKKKASRAKIKK
jgi:transcriptional regulator with XRE-family HTH domain